MIKTRLEIPFSVSHPDLSETNELIITATGAALGRRFMCEHAYIVRHIEYDI